MLLKYPNVQLRVAVDDNQLRAVASETVDPTDWPLPAESRFLHSTNLCNLPHTRQPTCLCHHSGYFQNTLSGILTGEILWHFQSLNPRTRVRAPVAAASLANCSLHLHHAILVAREVLPCVGWGVTASQLDLQSPTPLSVAGCGRLKLGSPHWATSVTLLQVFDNLPHILW